MNEELARTITTMRLSECWGYNLDEKQLQMINDYIKELEAYKEMYFDKVIVINKAIKCIEDYAVIDDDYSRLYSVEEKDLIAILKGEDNGSN